MPVQNARPEDGGGSHLRAGEVRGVVETHRGAEVADAVPGAGREDALRLGDILQARVKDLHVKVRPRVRHELPLEVLQWEHELRHLSLWQPEHFRERVERAARSAQAPQRHRHLKQRPHSVQQPQNCHFPLPETPRLGSQDQGLVCACVTPLPLRLMGIVVTSGLTRFLPSFDSTEEGAGVSWRGAGRLGAGDRRRVVDFHTHPGRLL